MKSSETRVLNPINLLKFFEALKKHVGFCDYLRAEIGKTEVQSCSRTQPIDRVIGAHVKNMISRKRCLSILDLPTNMKPFSCDLGGSGGGYPKPPTTTSTSGKMTVKFLYMQYLQAIRSDSSIRTIDAVSQGLALRPSAISGFGLFALRPFHKNSLIIEYCGEMLTGEDLVNKRDAHYNLLGKRYQQSCYPFRLDELKAWLSTPTQIKNFEKYMGKSIADLLLIDALPDIKSGDSVYFYYKFRTLLHYLLNGPHKERLLELDFPVFRRLLAKEVSESDAKFLTEGLEPEIPT